MRLGVTPAFRARQSTAHGPPPPLLAPPFYMEEPYLFVRLILLGSISFELGSRPQALAQSRSPSQRSLQRQPRCELRGPRTLAHRSVNRNGRCHKMLYYYIYSQQARMAMLRWGGRTFAFRSANFRLTRLSGQCAGSVKHGPWTLGLGPWALDLSTN
jgi:hypothetical protein